MKRPLFIITLVAYLAILIIDTAQLVGLYRDLVGETIISPWLSLFALNLIVLLLSFHRPEWGRLNPAGVFASIIGILHFIFFNTQFEGTPILQLGFLSQILPAVLFSCFFSYAIYFLAARIASMSEEMAKTEEESRKAFERRMKAERSKLEADQSEFEEKANKKEDALKAERSIIEQGRSKLEEDRKAFESWKNIRQEAWKDEEERLSKKEDRLLEEEERLNELGKKVSYGNGFVKVDWSNGKVSVKKVSDNGK